MPVEIFGTQMERDNVRWRRVSSDLNGAGPTDRTLVIKFTGDPAVLSGLNGGTLDIAKFRQKCNLANQDWIPAEGTFRCSLTPGIPLTITVAFN